MSQLDAAVQLKRESVKKSDARVVSSWLCSKSLRFKRLQLQVFGRKNVHGKKGLRLWIVPSVHQVFWREKSFNVKKIFSHQKSSIFFVLTLGAVQTCRIFFFLSAIVHTQKKVKESLYFGWLPGPFKSATLFFLYLYNNKEIKTVWCIKDFICLWVYLINTMLY